MKRPFGLLAVALAGSLTSCASSRSEDSQPEPTAAEAPAPQFRATRNEVRISARSTDIASFVPAVELRTEGPGECARHDALPMPGLPTGAYMLQLHYPDRTASHSVVTVTLVAAGRLLRYGEIRGMRRSSNPDFEAAQAEMRAVRTTNVTADLTKNEAFVVNMGGGVANQGVRGPVSELEVAGLLAGFRDRADMVIARCKDR